MPQQPVQASRQKPVAAEINDGDAIGSQCGGFIYKIAERSPQRILVKIAGADDIKACSLQCLRNQAGVIGRCRERSGRIIRIADDQREALLRRLGADRG